MAKFAGQLISTRADKQMAFSDNIYDTSHKKFVSELLGGAVNVEVSGTTTTGFLKTYNITDLYSNKTYTIDIPKDLVVTSGSIVKGTWNGDKFTEEETGLEKALKLIIANQEDPVYINVKDLVDIYTEGNGITVSDSNVISAKKAETKDSEDFLTINGDGIKVSGINDAITGAVNNANYLTNVNVNGTEGSVNNKVASVTIKGDDVEVADTYTATVYSTPFEEKVTTANAHITSTDKVNEALKKVETTISLLTDEVLDNEEVVSTAVNQIATAAGIIDSDNKIGYQKVTDTHYIGDANSVHEATVNMDKNIAAKIGDVETSINDVKTSLTDLESDVLKNIVNGDGISVGTKANNEQSVSVNIDDTTGTNEFLSVDANGLKVSGVTTAIETAINNANHLTNIVVNGAEGTVSNKVASVTIKGDDVEVADTYTATVYPTPFEEKVTTADAHVAANDKVDKALGKVEKTISLLTSEIIDNENVVSVAINQMATAAGVLGEDNSIKYQQATDANYIADATSVHEATVKLDSKIATELEGVLKNIESGNGIEVSTKESNKQTVSVLKDNDSDEYFTLSSNGIKISGIKDDIKAATTTVAANDTHITVTPTTEADGHTLYTIASNDTASATVLNDETEARKTADDKIEASVGLAEDGSHIKTSGNYTSLATTVVGEIAALDEQVYTNTSNITKLQEAKVSVEHSTEEESVKYLEVTHNDAETVYTVKAKGIDAAIEVEANRAKDAETTIDNYVGKTDIPEGKTVMGVISDNKANNETTVTTLATAAGVIKDGVIGYQTESTANFIADATSVHDATVKLDSMVNNMLILVSGSNAITVSDKALWQQKISLKLATRTDKYGKNLNPLDTTNGLDLSIIDCGEYE